MTQDTALSKNTAQIAVSYYPVNIVKLFKPYQDQIFTCDLVATNTVAEVLFTACSAAMKCSKFDLKQFLRNVLFIFLSTLLLSSNKCNSQA